MSKIFELTKAQARKLEGIVKRWKSAKAREILIREKKWKIEGEISVLIGEENMPNRGTFHVGAMKAVVTETTSWDHVQLAEIEKDWPSDLVRFPFPKVYKPDNDAISALRDNAPELYNRLQSAVLETKSGKPVWSINGVSTEDDLKNR